MKEISALSQRELDNYLRAFGVTPTNQRTKIASVLFAKSAHYSAEDVYKAVNQSRSLVSKATVYNTLGLFVERGLIREVLVDPSKVFYDSNTEPHHHFYDVDSGQLQDITEDQVAVKKLPQLPAGTELDSVEIMVRVRKQQAKSPA